MLRIHDKVPSYPLPPCFRTDSGIHLSPFGRIALAEVASSDDNRPASVRYAELFPIGEPFDAAAYAATADELDGDTQWPLPDAPVCESLATALGNLGGRIRADANGNGPSDWSTWLWEHGWDFPPAVSSTRDGLLEAVADLDHATRGPFAATLCWQHVVARATGGRTHVTDREFFAVGMPLLLGDDAPRGWADLGRPSAPRRRGAALGR